MMPMRSPQVLLLVCCLPLGCSSSPPLRYYTLNEIAATAPPVAISSQIPVRVEPIVIPQELDRLEIVTRIGPNRLRISESDHWAAPLEDQVRRVLSDDLSTRLPPRELADPNEPAGGGPRRLLSVSISNFLADSSCSVTLRADWMLRGPNTGTERGTESVVIPGNEPCTAPAAEQMSSALAVLADRLATMILSATGSAPTSTADQRPE
jgi:uncharacterized lipoprotein YmbA